MTDHVDVAVIGAGTMGAATAWHLARRGRRVLLVEQFEPGHRNGSSHGGVRIFRHAYPDPHYVGLAARALPLWRDLEADTGETLLELNGCYDHGPSAVLDEITAALDVHAVGYERLSPDAATERVPGLRFDDDVLFHGLAGRCFADRTVVALARRTAELGGEVCTGVRARVRLAAGGDEAEIDLGDRVVTASTVVVTAGAWVNEHLAALGIPTLPVLVTQEQVAHFAPLDDTATWPSFIHHVSPFRYGLHTPGEGLKVGGHHEGSVVSADDRTYELDEVRLNAVREYVERWVPGVDPTPILGATCLYTTTANEDFVLDRVGPVVIGSPCSGHGFKFTPLIGSLLADLAMLPAAHVAADVDAVVGTIVDRRHRLAAFTA